MVESSWDIPDEEDDNWEVEESWDDAPELDKKKSSTYGVYQASTVNRPWHCMEKWEVLDRQREMVEEVIDDIGISKTLARALLLKYDWKKNDAMQNIANQDDHLTNLFKFDLQKDVPMLAEGEYFMCGSCYCEYEQEEVVTMPDCSHQLCTYCFTAYVETKVKQGAEAFLTKCPEQKCENIVSEDIFKRLLSAEMFDKFEKYSYETYIDRSGQMKWCPGKTCN